MDSNTLTTDTAVSLTSARTALQSLWNMLQDEDGNPLSVEANNLLATAYEQYEAIARVQQQGAARIVSLLEMVQAARDQRDQILRHVDEARTKGWESAIRSIAYDLHLNYRVAPEVAQTVINLLTGTETDMPGYVSTAMRRAVDLVEEEIRERRELDATDSTLGEPEDDYEPE